jgi:DNA polymerase III subunit gamma/tau
MSDETSTKSQSYTVVARRYRPRTFTELIGQEHIAQALSKAIASGRVGHAYLFTGARGVGKTSTARIFAKALNETAYADATAIETGEDMDVIEIDGASNRGIDEIRQLRANVTVRPSRARYKIYIIDEVHMLTNQAFNALLKTLEEPPEHVKFIFCTTDPDKLPITVLSRCQRFDFVPVKFEAIQQRLKEISLAEGYDAEDEALALLARKAAGSMRDSQSLLEQVMSFSTERITAEQVHALLGTADEGRLIDMVEALRNRSPLEALAVVDQATRGGADPGQLAEQLLNYLRDVMTAGIGGGPELLKLANPAGHARLAEAAKSWGVQTVLSAIQILDESLVRMRSSVSSTTLLEVALVQICQLQDLALIPAMIDAILRGGPMPTVVAPRPPERIAMPPAAKPDDEKKNAESQALATPSNTAETSPVAAPAPVSNSVATHPQSQSLVNPTTTIAAQTDVAVPPTSVPQASAQQTGYQPTSPRPSALVNPATNTTAVRAPIGSAAALEDWKRAMASIDGMLADFGGLAQAVEPLGSDQWTIYFPPGSQKPKEYCEVAERKAVLQEAVERTMGRAIRLNFAVPPGPPPKVADEVPQANVRAKRLREIAEHPMVKEVCELLGGEVLRIEAPVSGPPAPASAGRSSTPVEHAT